VAQHERNAEVTDSERNDLVKWVGEKLGVPSAILAVMFVGLWWVISGLHDSVLVPAVKSHTDYLQRSIENQTKQAEALKTLADAAETHADAEKKQTEILSEIADNQEDIKDTLRQGHPSIGAIKGER
jgi:F0F1-type ATP synthase membrane subunit b/b'